MVRSNEGWDFMTSFSCLKDDYCMVKIFSSNLVVCLFKCGRLQDVKYQINCIFHL